LVEKDQATGCF